MSCADGGRYFRRAGVKSSGGSTFPWTGGTFPEPLNQKAEAVMISNGLKPAGFMSEQITEEDITDNTLILTMSEESRQKIFELFRMWKKKMLRY